jgi:hypothetical protein
VKGTIYTTPPPGYLTVAQTVEILGMSRANFHDKGLAACLDRWQVSQSTTLYRKEDVADLAHWLEVRRGMVALGHWPNNTPGVPGDGDLYAAAQEGYWDVDCPGCGGEAVGMPDGERVWCPSCGIH